MKEVLQHPINIIRRMLSLTSRRLIKFRATGYKLGPTLIRLRCLLRQEEALGRYRRDQLMALQEVQEALANLARKVAAIVDGNSEKDGPPIDFDTILTAASLPDKIAGELKTKPIKIVDVGALELDGQDDLYKALCAQCSCEVIGFDPQVREAITVAGERSVKTILPIAVGNGKVAHFHCTEYRGASSMFRPNQALLEQFISLPTMLTVREESEIQTIRLDDVKEVDGCDLLKIDVQGGELNVLKGALALLQKASLILTEVEFGAVYEDQPLFADIDKFLRDQGFFLHDFKNPGYSAYKAGIFGDLKGRLLWMDAVYVKEPSMMEKLDPESILKAAVMAHVLLQNPGLAASILRVFDRKTGKKFSNIYRLQLNALRNALGDVHTATYD
ncbi:MAG: FkbM family methyltransferase [Desulfomonilaceae bacterium]